ncbi:MAG: hypothetical protein HC794_01830 [Nitrospiraceae bacterium]|nr:hypothetical protein [Nitrospiraceae bacterium]
MDVVNALLMTPANGEKVYALVKTQTRRKVKPQPADSAILPLDWSAVMKKNAELDIYGGDGLTWGNVPMQDGSWGDVRCPYGTIGSRLYIKEACWIWGRWVKNGARKDGTPASRFVESTKRMSRFCLPGGDIRTIGQSGYGWVRRNGLFMPQWAARSIVELTEIRLQRLNEISEDDAKAEGCAPVVHADGSVDCGTRKTVFAQLIDPSTALAPGRRMNTIGR